MSNQVEFTRINCDINGNPRYVCHFNNFVTDKDREEALALQRAGRINSFVDEMYRIAIRRAKKLGGRKFHNKQYGGGIVFQSYNINLLSKKIIETYGVNNI